MTETMIQTRRFGTNLSNQIIREPSILKSPPNTLAVKLARSKINLRNVPIKASEPLVVQKAAVLEQNNPLQVHSTLEPHPNSFFSNTPIKTTPLFTPASKYSREFLRSFKDVILFDQFKLWSLLSSSTPNSRHCHSFLQKCTQKPNFFCCEVILKPYLIASSPDSERKELNANRPAKQPSKDSRIKNPRHFSQPKAKNGPHLQTIQNDTLAQLSSDNTTASTTVATVKITPAVEKQKKETDPKRLEARQKQIDIGMNTVGYQSFKKFFDTLSLSEQQDADLPRIPSKYQICSKRSWDGQVRKWRRGLHVYDDQKDANASDILSDDESRD